MSRVFQQRPGGGGICRLCQHDLRVKPGEEIDGPYRHPHGHQTVRKADSDGAVYCSNPACQHFTVPYRTGNRVHLGGYVAYPNYAALSEALGPLVVDGINANQT